MQDARVTTTQHQNAHMDTKRDRDGLQSALTQTQQALDVEVAAKADLLTLANQLKEKLNFQQQLHEKVLWDATIDTPDKLIINNLFKGSIHAIHFYFQSSLYVHRVDFDIISNNFYIISCFQKVSTVSIYGLEEPYTCS